MMVEIMNAFYCFLWCPFCVCVAEENEISSHSLKRKLNKFFDILPLFSGEAFFIHATQRDNAFVACVLA